MTPDQRDRWRQAIDALEPQAAVFAALFAGRLTELRPDLRLADAIDATSVVAGLRMLDDAPPDDEVDGVVADALRWAIRHCLGPRYDADLDAACRQACALALRRWTPVHSPAPRSHGTPHAVRSKA